MSFAPKKKLNRAILYTLVLKEPKSDINNKIGYFRPKIYFGSINYEKIAKIGKKCQNLGENAIYAPLLYFFQKVDLSHTTISGYRSN